VPLPQIADCAAQYNARIFELRRLGFRITNRTKEIDGVRHSWFRLVRSPGQPAQSTYADSLVKAREWPSIARIDPPQQSLFSTGNDAAPLRWMDPEEGWS
jgi:hypothetical protein